MMRRIFGPAAVLLLAVSSAPFAFAQTPDELAQTAHYLASLQNRDGGFGAKPGGESTLGTTSSAVRTLKNVGGSIPDVAGCLAYVQKCVDPKTGAFAPSPGGQPDVRTTAIGLMAAAELKIADEKMTQAAVAFFSENAKTFEDIRIAVAGLEAVGAKSPDFAKWAKQVESDRNADGTWGQGAAKARDTGGAAAALLRMGVELSKKDAVLAALREGQRPDGGWAKADGPSDLESSYRIMRCLTMLKQAPDLDRLRAYLARHRQSDGSYAPSPGGPGDLGGTYFAAIMLRWARLLSNEPALLETAGFAPLFNGKDLAGWEGDTSLWSARDGMLVGKTAGLKHNDFLATEKSYGDFILKFSFRLVGGEGNSGVQFRSVRVPGHEMSGYQADIGQNYWGCLYDESRRNKVLVQASAKALESANKGGWNHYVIRALGNRILLTLNGVTSVDYREEDAGIASDGKIAVQIHAGGPMEIQFKDLYIQALARPTADNPMGPGFHLRTVKAADGERKYTVFVPKGYDGQKAFPAVLFLHGSGERGDDGIVSSQVGLGAIIAQHPDDFPAIAVFPQARKTWQADSDDARAALAALDDVMAGYKVDPRKVALTGLSMGGRGSWEMAATHPKRFSAVAPICGPGRKDDVSVLKALPLWSFVGDADRDATVLNLREMASALRDVGASPRLTEYRGVGHNSWDRAYSDPKLIDWMLSQSRQEAP
jgi:acetyl esterase/lipase/prenyltransferase beta subunit